MKKLLLFGVALFSFAAAQAQCSGLFFSEYVEGSNNNKALEIYNPTPNAITINGDYRIVRYNNGTGAAVAEGMSQAMVILGQHTIQPYDVWVLVIDKRNPLGTAAETPVDAALQLQADTFVCPDYAVSYALYHNGNDAVSLQRNVGGNWVYQDIIGEIGFDPVNSWSDCPPFFDGSCGAYYTKDQTLIRKSNIQGGYTSNPSPFDATQTWDSLPNNTFSMLGFHNCNCDPSFVGLKEVQKLSEVKLFPNPSNGSSVTFVSADKKITKVTLINALGQIVKSIPISKSTKVSLDLNVAKGIYMTEILFEDKSVTSERLIVE